MASSKQRVSYFYDSESAQRRRQCGASRRQRISGAACYGSEYAAQLANAALTKSAPAQRWAAGPGLRGGRGCTHTMC
eukprot:366115-Chlamydomonas_euryale.AAC.6